MDSRTNKVFKQHLAVPKSASTERGGVSMYAIIETGGKQYRVMEGDTVHVEKLNIEQGQTVKLESIIAVSDENGVVIGAPYVAGATVEATVVEHGKGAKVVIYKFKRKKDYRKKQGHRQPFTALKIEKIAK